MKRILIIDDAATVRMYYRSILEEGGYHVVEAVNGIEAMEKALQGSFDLYIVDINMPKQDGYGFLTDLRSREELHQTPALMVSTEAKPTDRKRAYVCGANLYLLKPVKPEELLVNTRILLGEVQR
ncbi:response regulator [Geomonas sp. RF6]|uniref:response regulator n=1 Tax=Geomonas sp. RF6 TaxID=2897342 RepID=UPI001E3ECACB|nr:response regulator [Geomonas sp. RF6]UFS72543.1 response regulator [Geomonas sp. RF6]